MECSSHSTTILYNRPRVQTLSNTIEWVYTAFFCSNSAQQLRNISEEVLFGHFMITLNDTFQWELTLEDEGYESGSESLNIPTPLHRTPYLYYVSASENLSFRPATPLTHWAHLPHQHSSLSSICCHLTFSNDDSSSADNSPLQSRTEQFSPVEQQMAQHLTDDSFQDDPSEEEEEEEEEEEDFPTAPLEDDIWMDEPVPDRHLCIHEQSQLHDLCPYPCLYNLDQLHPTSENAPTPHQWWTSATSLISQMWWQPPVMWIYLVWMMFWTVNKDSSLDKHWYSLNFLHMKQDNYVYEYWKLVWLWILINFKHILATWIIISLEL